MIYLQLLLLSLSLIFSTGQVIRSRQNTQVTQNDIFNVPKSNKKLVQIYLGSLCPDCLKVLSQQLPRLTTPQASQFLQVRLIPYGLTTSRRSSNTYTFTCQLGQSQCQGNTILLCAQAIYDKQAFPFITCLAKSSKRWNTDGETCARLNGVNWQSIKACTNTQWAKQQMYDAGLETNAVGVKAVPMFAVDGGRVRLAKGVDILGEVCVGQNSSLCSRKRNI